MSTQIIVPGRKRTTTRMLAALAGIASAMSLAQAASASPAHAASIGSQLGAISTLASGSSISSPDGTYRLDMQSDGNLVEYGRRVPVWATSTDSQGAYLVNQGDGNLVVYSASGVAIWASGTDGQGLANLVIQDDGNVVDYKGNSAIWSTYTSGRTSRLTASRAVAFAMEQLGKPYRFGGTGPASYDCSGLAQASYAAAGVSIARTSQQQWTQGQPVSAGALRPGDLVFYYSSTSPSHVAMYIGKGQIIEALKAGTNIRIDSIDYPGAPVGYRRYA